MNAQKDKSNTLNTLAAIHYMEGNFAKSLPILNEALEILNNLGLGDTPTAENIKDNLEKLKRHL